MECPGQALWPVLRSTQSQAFRQSQIQPSVDKNQVGQRAHLEGAAEGWEAGGLGDGGRVSKRSDSGTCPGAAVIWGHTFHHGRPLPSRRSFAAWHNMDSVLPELSIFHRKKKNSKFSKEFSQLFNVVS